MSAERLTMTPQQVLCEHIDQLIDALRGDMYMAVRMDEFIEWLRFRISQKEQGNEEIEIDEEAVMECLRRDKRVVVYEYANTYVLWLWNGEAEVLKRIIVHEAYKHARALIRVV
jgi:hypothetical protein